RYISDLAGEVTRQRVHVVGEVLPRSADARYFRLTAEHSLGAHLARHARHFRGERAQLVHHRVDGVLQLENLTFHVHRDLPRQIALRHSGSNVSNVSDLAGEVGRHRVHVVREILPRAADSGYLRLTTELSFGSHFLGDTGYFRSKSAQLIDHRVDGVLELERFTPGFDGDLLREVSLGDRGSHSGNISDLAGEISRERVHVVGEVLPRSRDARNFCLSAKLPFCSYFARNARDFVGEGAELIDHRVDRGGDSKELSLHRLAIDLEHHLLIEIAVGDSRENARYLSRWRCEIGDERVDGVNSRPPAPG